MPSPISTLLTRVLPVLALLGIALILLALKLAGPLTPPPEVRPAPPMAVPAESVTTTRPRPQPLPEPAVEPPAPAPLVVAGAEISLPGAPTLPVYDLRIEPSSLRVLDRNPYGRDTQPAVFSTGGTTWDPVRLRYRGAWARSWPKKPMKVLFEDAHRFEGHRSLNLNAGWRDPAFFREALAYHIFAACGVPSPRARVVRVNFNGEFRGLYVEVEQPDRTLLERLDLKGATLYKTSDHSEGADERDYQTPERCARAYTNENHPEKGVGELAEFCHELARTPKASEFFDRRVDVTRFVNYLAACALTQHWDWHSKNHFVVHDVKHGGRWFIMPWDLDRTLGDHWDGSFDTVDLPMLLGTRQQPGVVGWNRLQDKFFTDPALRAKFRTRLTELLATEFTPAKLFPLIDQYEAAIRADVARDRRRWPSPAGDLHRGVTELKSYIQRRRAFLEAELSRFR